MERLTFEGNFCEIAKCLDTPGGSFCEEGSCSQRKVWERLKQYEDTGLTPEEIDSLPEAWMEKVKELDSGSLIRLPCKIGDKVWTLKQAGKGGKRVFETKVDQMYFSDDMRLIVCAKYYRHGEIGQYIFLTREEAEAALRREAER